VCVRATHAPVACVIANLEGCPAGELVRHWTKARVDRLPS